MPSNKLPEYREVDMRIRPINRVARAMAYNRPRTQVVKSKKGKGSYTRNKDKYNDAVRVTISEAAREKNNRDNS